MKRKNLIFILAVILGISFYGVSTEASVKSRSDYLIPYSNTEYLSWDDVKDLSTEQMRIARNEIFARHGRKFKSADLQMYFDSRSWYTGRYDADKFNENVFNDAESYNIRYLKSLEPIEGKKGLSTAPTKSLIDAYGYESGHSVLSFTLLGGTIKDKGDYYIADALYHQGIEVPGSLEVGDKVTVTINEITGESWTLVRKEDGIYPVNDPTHQMYYYPSEDGSPVVLYEASDDRVDKPVYEGKLYIRKDATDEVQITRESAKFDPKNFTYDSWFNGVYFDTKGYVKRLVFIGD